MMELIPPNSTNRSTSTARDADGEESRWQLESYEHEHWLQFYRNGQLPAPTWVHMATGVYMLLIGLAGTIGNSVLAWAFIWCKSLRSPSNLLIANLAVADLGLSATTFPLLFTSSFAQRWLYGKTGCDYYGFSGGLFGMLSISTMASIAVDRFMSITKWQLWHLTYSRVALWLGGLWLYSFALAIPPILGWSAYVLEGVQTSCTFDFLSRTPATISFTCWLFFIGFCVPVCVIIVCYTKLVRYIADHQKAMDDAGLGPDAPTRSRVYSNTTHRSETGSDRAPAQAPAAEVKAATTCAVIVALFCLAWTPYAVVALLSTFGRPDIVSPYANSLPALFAKASAIYNPVVYALMNERFLRAVLVMLRLRRPSSRRRFPGSVPSISAQQRKTRLLSTTSTTFSTTSTTFNSPTSPTGITPTGLQRCSIDEGQEEQVELHDNRREQWKQGMRLSLDVEPTVILEDTGTPAVGAREQGVGDDELLLTPTPMTECFGCSIANTRE